MRIILSLLLCLNALTTNALPYRDGLADHFTPNSKVISLLSPKLGFLNPEYARLFDIKLALQKQAPELKSAVLNKVLSSLACAQKFHIQYNPVLTIIDYAIPANKKRMWVFDLTTLTLSYHSHVSHGITSGALNTVYFSNRNNSKASSLGVFLTGPAYYGREGLSLRLKGLDRGFNDNAMRRYIVMHGGWYMDERFIKKYGRPGRSWGCPSLPDNLKNDIINKIKDDTFLVIYYPSDDWLTHSKFLNCSAPKGLMVANAEEPVIQLANIQGDDRDPILFSDTNHNQRREQNEPIVVMKADGYIKTFKLKAPLQRMLRRQIDDQEYVALSPIELDRYMNKEAAKESDLADLYFIVPRVVKMRGVWRTLMKVVHHGKITEITKLPGNTDGNYLIQFDKKSNLKLKPSQRFIRWLGL